VALQPPPIHESRTAGVTTFRVEAPGPLTATLAFRVGHWDESVLDRGITHLVEHLALHPLRGVEHPYNGAVSGDTMMFLASGTEEQLQHFFEELCRILRALPAERLETEATVLRAEMRAHGTNTANQLLGILFGPNGPGLFAYDERGFELAGPKEVQDWVDRHCTKQNAVLLVSGPTVPAIPLDLPDGEHRPFRLPAEDVGYRPERLEVVDEQEAGICLGGLTRRTIEARLAWDILTQRLTDRLRHDLGLAYDVGSTYQPLDGDTAFTFAGVDAPSEDKLMQTARAFLDVVRELRRVGPTDKELERRREPLRESETEKTEFARSELYRVGLSRLLGHAEDTWEAILDERARATTDGIRDAFRAIADRAAVIAPRAAELALPERTPRRFDPVEGSVFRTRGRVAGELGKVIVGAAGLSGHCNDRWVTFLWNDLVAAEQPQTNAWSLLSRTGAWIALDTNRYWRRRRLRKVLEEKIPAAARVPRSRRK
jgi:predicted Zn-dependent peptidase